MHPTFSIRTATASDLTSVANLFRAYASQLGVDLSFQNFDTECATLPGAYAPPAGALLIAVSAAGDAIGCVGVRPLPEPGTCEMKRLHTISAARGAGVGRALAQAAIKAAAQVPYDAMRLDTLSTMVEAYSLYRQLGFEITLPYYASPVPGTIFMRKTLSPAEDIHLGKDHLTEKD